MSESGRPNHNSAADIPLVFAGSELDRCEPLREDGAWLQARLADPSSRFIVYRDLKPLMRVSPTLDVAYLGFEAVTEALAGGSPWIFLGTLGDSARFALAVADGETANELQAGYAREEKHEAKYIDVRSIALQWGAPDVDAGRGGIIAQGRALLDWHARHGFCAKCGAGTVMEKAGYLRRCQSATCAAEHFPRTDPVVIMLATRGDQCLVGRQAGFPAGIYSALAGFMEPGETIEEAVRREIHEEAGISVGRVDYHASQPWPFPSSLMIGCFAEALSEEITLDQRELEDAMWMDRETIRKVLTGEPGAPFGVPTRMAIAYTLMHYWAYEG